MMLQFRDKKQIARRKKNIRTAIGFGVFLMLVSVGLLAYMSGALHYIGLPIWKGERLAEDTAGGVGYIARTKASVFAENQKLKDENQSLKNAMMDYRILKSENDTLKALFERLPTNSDFVLATVLSKPNRSPYDTVVIDIGSDKGVFKGAKIYGDVKMPIGEVSEVYTNTSVVSLYSSPGYMTHALIDGSNTSVELVGRGGGNFEMTIPNDLLSDKGAMVVMPGINTEILAIVDGVISSPSDPAKKVILHSPINVQSLKWVFIKKN